MRRVLLNLFGLGLLGGCGEKIVTIPGSIDFGSIPSRAPITPGLIDEASGLADSRTIDGHVWVNEDSGTPAQLNLLSHGGKLAGRLALPGITNRDWEDMAAGPGPQPGVSYLYLADIGDNLAQNTQNVIYRLAEPKSLTESVGTIDRIAFRYADGPRDAETLLLDPLTRDLWIVSKGEANVRLYHLPYPQNTTAVNTAAFRGELPLTLVTSGSISPDGQEILLKTYTGVYYWPRFTGQTVTEALVGKNSYALTYQLEPQGEAIGFDKAGNGFFTLSERGNAASVTLNYYKHQ
ncbi:PE-PGRS family protein [Spirosoma sp. 209]|uniref:PE-PGRS family protein n=1 Tax=Spirosoma sp. 209 TaxID=1955701 RepID=UPI001117609E|nr:PE-PGRS family protein [Spirosoma sp. 209]